VYAGIEAGGTKFVCAVGTSPDDLSEPLVFPTTTPGESLGRVVDFVRGQQGVVAVGVASFGPVDLRPESPGYGRVTSTPKPGWAGADVVGTLVRALDLPVGFDTDVNGAALAETRWGAAAGHDTVAYVTVGTGIGVGVMVGGQLVHGLMHPEGGHLFVRRHPDDTYAGRCPYHGDCLEGLASGPAVEERWGRPGAELGDLREQAVATEASYLSQLAATLALVLSPSRIVFGGGIMHLLGLLDAVRDGTVALLNGYLDVPAVTERPSSWIVAPGLGDRAGVLGAVALAERARRG
jgi:fructokinase